MPYWKLYYHLVWATSQRQPLIDNDRARVIYATIYTKANELSIVVHAMESVQDHIHVVVSIQTLRSIADCVKHLKGASSRAVNVHEGIERTFRWQEGYGALSISERSLPTVVAYVKEQKQHHHEGITTRVYEITESSSDDFRRP